MNFWAVFRLIDRVVGSGYQVRIAHIMRLGLVTLPGMKYLLLQADGLFRTFDQYLWRVPINWEPCLRSASAVRV
jgi:RecB family endonuclease NucS